ncbi:MAG: hypothetical protein WC915_06240 [archaeon]|jgi:hypothetical protein
MPPKPGKIRAIQRQNKKANETIISKLDLKRPIKKPLTKEQQEVWKKQHFDKNGLPKTRVSR